MCYVSMACLYVLGLAMLIPVSCRLKNLHSLFDDVCDLCVTAHVIAVSVPGAGRTHDLGAGNWNLMKSHSCLSY